MATTTVAAGASGNQQAAEDLEADILAYIIKYNAYIDKKIEAAESGDAAAFFNDNPGLADLLNAEIEPLQTLKVTPPIIHFIANPGQARAR
ncbi:hypothetical protein LTR27_013000 [Elasticomyces elasticus]|nr:hypothetical protein LTR27_013000 [Elasticomyces elasticus]